MKFYTSLLLLSASVCAENLTDALTGTYNSTGLEQERKGVLAFNENAVQARAGFRPQAKLSASTSRARTANSGEMKDTQAGFLRSPGTSSTDGVTNQVGAQLSQNLFNGGATVAAIDGADNAIKAKWAELLASEQKALSEMAALYCQILAKKKEIEFYTANLDFLTKQFESTHDKFKVGEETITNVSSAEADLAGGIASKLSAEAELDGLMAQYFSIVGRRPQTFDKPNIPTFLPKNMDEALVYARANHPDILKATYQASKAECDKDKEGGALLPSIDLSAGTARNENQGKNFYNDGSNTGRRKNFSTTNSVKLEVSVPLYEGGAIRSKVRAACESSAAARIALSSARAKVDQDVVSAWQAFKAAEANLVNYQKQIEARALTVQSTEQEKEAGSKTLVDVLKAQKDLLDAQKNYVSSERQYYTMAFKLAYAVGMLTAEKLKLPVEIFRPEQHYNDTKWKF
jgi:outer membrane protein